MVAAIDGLQAENQELRQKLREAELREGALTQALAELRKDAQWHGKRLLSDAKLDLAAARQRFKLNHEVPVYRCLGWSGSAVAGIYSLFDRDLDSEIVSLQDLAYVARASIAGAKGVGPRSMEKLDAAMAEHGLKWADATHPAKSRKAVA